MTILEKNSAIFSKIGKVYLLNWDFSANWEFFKPIGKKFGTENRTQFCIEKKPWLQTSALYGFWLLNVSVGIPPTLVCDLSLKLKVLINICTTRGSNLYFF